MIEKHDKYYNLQGAFYGEKIDPLINFINDNSGTILIGIFSSGGSAFLGRFLLKILNENKDRISLIAHETICSIAFEVFYLFEGQKFLAQGTIGMTHFCSRSIQIADSGHPSTNEGLCIRRNLKHDRKQAMDFHQKFLTKTEIGNLKRALDIYFTFERMKEIFPDAIII